MNRRPIDLVEGESELVSGFNVEYFGAEFVSIFIAEYGMILFFFFFYIILLIFSICCFDFFHETSRECVSMFLHPIGVSLAESFNFVSNA